MVKKVKMPQGQQFGAQQQQSYGPALSDLSVTEFLTLSRMGFLPRGIVIGVAVYDAGFEQGMTGYTQEVVQIGQAMRAARQLAVNRLRQQAASLGAEGVVGVRLSVEHHRWRGGHIVARFVAVGTAIAFDRSHAPPEFKDAPSLRLQNGPFTSDLAGQDFVTLLRAGYRPVSIALGNCVYEVSQLPLQGIWNQGNIEITEYTLAFMNARETAMQNLERDLESEFGKHNQGVDAPVGVVGMTVDEQAHAGAMNLIEYTAVGTAIAHIAEHDPRKAATLPAPVVVVPLDY
jgi:uncharacterized protein YbjQ (UPF0145 family)